MTSQFSGTWDACESVYVRGCLDARVCARVWVCVCVKNLVVYMRVSACLCFHTCVRVSWFVFMRVSVYVGSYKRYFSMYAYLHMCPFFMHI